MVLLIGAGLLVRTLWTLHNMNPGLQAQNVLTLETPRPRESNRAQDAAFMEQVIERVRALPGVDAAAAATNVPLSGEDEENWTVQLENEPPEPVVRLPWVATNVVTPGYFATLHIPILRGRDFSYADTAERPRVIIISKAMAERFWPNQDPIGRRIFSSVFEPKEPREVVAVVGDTKELGLERTRSLAEMYVPFTQAPHVSDSLLIKTRSTPAEMIPAITQAIHEIDRQQPVVRARMLDEIIGDSYSDRRSNMLLLVSFAGLALVLAAAGIYGVLSYSVRRRLREIGIRLALGAKVRDVLRLVIFEGMRPTMIGIIVGIIGALALTRVLATMIFGVRATDLRTYVAVAILLALVSLLACILPAYRATRVQPLNVLRDE
jgi:predicted permease